MGRDSLDSDSLLSLCQDPAQMPAMGMSRMGGTDASSRLLVEASGQA